MNWVWLQRTIQQICFWSGLPVISLLFYLNDFVYYLAAIIGVIAISKIGASIGHHRYFSHRSFRMPQWKENIVAILATLSTTGSVLQWSTIHRYHHRNSDNGNDIHSPHEIGGWRAFWHWYRRDPTTLAPLSSIKDLLVKPFLIFTHNYYFLIIATYITILSVIDPMLILFAYVLPVSFTWWTSGTGTWILHLDNHGYRNFDTGDHSVNSRLYNWLTLGEGLHNNHHARPGEYDTAFTRRPGEWDFSAKLVEVFLK